MPVRRAKTRRVDRPCTSCKRRGGSLGYGRGGSLGYGKKMNMVKKFLSWTKKSALPWLKKNKALSRGLSYAADSGRLGRHSGNASKLGKYASTKGYEALHKRQVTKLRKELGVRALDSGTIQRKGKVLFKDKFLGVFSQDSRFPETNGYAVMNNDYLGGAGIHWLAVIRRGNQLYVYDSFGRFSKNILPTFTVKMQRKGYKVNSADPSDADQFGYASVDCGHRCLSALMIANSKGIPSYMQL